VSSEVTVDRLQFTLTVTYHYLFPILTMGLALFIAYFKTVSYLAREDRHFPLLRKTAEERVPCGAPPATRSSASPRWGWRSCSEWRLATSSAACR
jgi:hypothetical protein